MVTYRQGTDERAKRALDILQFTFQCCGSDGRLSYQNNVPLSCNMFSVGCLPRTMYFLDACLDALAIVLLGFSLIKIFIILFFYVFLWYYRKRRSRSNKSDSNDDDDSSSIWRHSSSLDSSSRENHLSQKSSLNHDYSPTLITRERIPNPSNESIRYYQSSSPRKLSLISEQAENDDIEAFKPREYTTTIVRTNDPPIVPSRRKIDYYYDEDSGVERSSSERSLNDQRRSNSRSPTSLSFSKVFVTSVSEDDPLNNPSDLQRPLIPPRNTQPKSILKKTLTDPQQHPWSYTRSPSILLRIPKPNPRRSKPV